MAYNKNGGGGYPKKNFNNQSQKREGEQFDVEKERQLYYAWLSDPKNLTEIRQALGPKIDVDRWLAAARDAVEVKPNLLAPSLRQSLLFAVKKAAQQTLKPDGRQGALIPRGNSDAHQKLICWQPMVQGVMLLGRRAKVLKTLTAEFVLAGEPFKFLRGDDPRIVHEWVPEIREKAYALLRNPAKQSNPDGPPDYDGDQGGPQLEAFWDKVVAAYCIIEAPDGSKTRRALTRSRLLLLRDFAKARGGPWFSVWLDEMIIKSAIHHTAKHIDTNVDNEHALAAFRDALEQDMDADLDEEDEDVIDGHAIEPANAPALPAANPMDKLHRFDQVMQGAEQEKVAVEPAVTEPPPPQQDNLPPEKPPPYLDEAPPAAEGEPPPEEPETAKDPILDNDDGMDATDPDVIKAIPGAKQWAKTFLSTDLARIGNFDSWIAVFGIPGAQNSGNRVILKRLAFAQKHMPKTYAILEQAIAAKEALIKHHQQSDAA